MGRGQERQKCVRCDVLNFIANSRMIQSRYQQAAISIELPGSPGSKDPTTTMAIAFILTRYPGELFYLPSSAHLLSLGHYARRRPATGAFASQVDLLSLAAALT